MIFIKLEKKLDRNYNLEKWHVNSRSKKVETIMDKYVNSKPFIPTNRLFGNEEDLHRFFNNVDELRVAKVNRKKELNYKSLCDNFIMGQLVDFDTEMP